MTLLGKNNLGAMIGLLISISLGLCSCSSEPSSKQQTMAISPSSDTLPNNLGADAAEVLIKHYQYSQGEDVDDNFFFDGKMVEADKVVSFRLNPKQAADFFEELDKLKIHYKDIVRIRIWMAFRGKNGHKLEKETNVVPLLELIVHDKNPTGNFYPLRPFKSKILPLFKTLYQWDTIKFGNSRINPLEAHTLVKNWDKIPVDDITEQLYFDNQHGAPGDRLQYYTFDAADTESIYKYQTKIARKKGKDKCYFYIHLGQLQERKYIALRTIIHLDDNPILRNKKDQAIVDDEPPYFEFARPCPNLCD